MEREDDPSLLAQLDDLCLLHVASFLDRRDLAAYGLTCKRLTALTSSAQHLWQALLYAEFGLLLKVRP